MVVLLARVWRADYARVARGPTTRAIGASREVARRGRNRTDWLASEADSAIACSFARKLKAWVFARNVTCRVME